MHEGHRERMRAQLRQSGMDSLSDVQVLEVLLYHAFAVGGTLQRTVVRDDECSVAGHPHIGLESPVSCPITGFKGPERVLVVFQAPSPV